MGAPLAVGYLCAPYLLHGFGAERFGLITIVWALVGYFSIFDLGLSRAITNSVSKHLALSDNQGANTAALTGCLMVFTLGLLVGGAVFFGASVISTVLVKHSNDLLSETRDCFAVVALSIPFVMISNAFIGILEAHQRFDKINVVRLVLGVSNFLLPVLIVMAQMGLVEVAELILFSRLSAVVVYLFMCRRYCQFRLNPINLRRSAVAELFSFGSWIALANIISPLASQIDKFIIGTLVPLASVAFYTMPAELIGRLFVIPAAITAVLFSSFSRGYKDDRNAQNLRFSKAIDLAYVLTVIPTASILFFSNSILSGWLGDDFARTSASCLQFLAIGFLANSIARVPYTYMQSNGRPDLATKINLMELPIYVAGLYIAVKQFGIVGAAYAFALRTSIDLILLAVGARYVSAKKLSISYLYPVLFSLILLTGIAVLDFLPLPPLLILSARIACGAFLILNCIPRVSRNLELLALRH